MAVKLISIKRHKDGEMISAWLDEENAYVSYAVNKTGATRVQEFSKKNYKSYDHFANVLGKFKPDVLFLASPVKVENYTFEALNATFEYLALEGIVERDKVEKFNPHHDEKGRFARGDGEQTEEPVAWYDNDEITVAHGTSQAYLKNILATGVLPQKYHNWDKTYYTGKREGKVFIAVGEKGKEMAAAFAQEAAYVTKEEPVVVEAKVPKDFFKKQATRDHETHREEADAYTLPYVKPEWITGVYKVQAYSVGEREEVPQKPGKADEETVTIFVPMDRKLLNEVLAASKKKKEK